MTQYQPQDQDPGLPEPTSRRLTAQEQMNQAERVLGEVTTSVAVLRTEADRARGMVGFGRRILVPPDEIHVVVGDGRHVWTMSNERKVFGQSADRPSRYWLNALTQVIKLKTISFTVALNGPNNQGIDALDSSKVSFYIWAHAVAKLNPAKAEIAAQRVGLDTTGLIYTITKVGTSELVAAAAGDTLENIIANRQQLAEIAFPKVNEILSELGYDLALLTITRLDGEAYIKLVQQAEARVSKETGIATNREQLAELEDQQSRQRFEAEIGAETEKKLASERLDAQREVETATISQQEALDSRRHEMQLKQIEREKAAAEAEHAAELAKVQLAQQLGQAEAEKKAQLAQIEAQRAAELKAAQQKREAAIRLAEAEAKAERLAIEQAREIERNASLTEAEASRLREEEIAQANRSKEISLLEARQIAEAMQLEAEAEAHALQTKIDAETKVELVKAEAEVKALQTRVDAETQMELVKAEAEATATEKRAQAAKVRAEATKAETAALGLAEAEVEAARVQVSEKQVAVNRAEGLAQAEVSLAQAEAEAERLKRLKDVEINAQKEMARLFEQAPVLVDLEKMKMQLAHDEKMAEIQMEAQLKAFQAIAPGIKVHIFGNGGQTGQIMANLLALSHGVESIGNEVPLVANLLGQSQNGDVTQALTNFMPRLDKFVPHLQQLMAETDPRMFSTLKVVDVVERLGSVISGQEDLVTALNHLKQDASFRVVGDLPIAPIIKLLGIGLNAEHGDDSPIAEEIKMESGTNGTS